MSNEPVRVDLSTFKPEGYVNSRFVGDVFKINLLARVLAAYDEATWQKLKPGRKRTYIRAATTYLHCWEQIEEIRKQLSSNINPLEIK